jgi:hypothetical protein
MVANKPLPKAASEPRKQRPSLFSFEWKKDAAGYDISPDRRRIVRRGGIMQPVDPSSADVPLHRTFAHLETQVWQPDEDRSGHSEEAAPSFHLRRFEDMESALLEFVRAYGFLGSPAWGSDALEEPLDYLMQEQKRLSILFDFFLEHDFDRNPIEAQFNSIAPPMRLRLVKGYRGLLQVQVVPETLHAWMYWRIAEDCRSGVDWSGAPCLHCGAPMGRGPGAHRRDAEFCKPKCRIYFFRAEKRERVKRRQERARTRKDTET